MSGFNGGKEKGFGFSPEAPSYYNMFKSRYLIEALIAS